MNYTQWKRRLALILIIALSVLAFAACTSSEDGAATTPEAGAPGLQEDGQAAAPAADDTFELLDANNNGILEEREFNLLLAQAEIANEGQFGAYDANSDARLSQEEFNTYLKDQGLAPTADLLPEEIGAAETDGTAESQSIPDYRAASRSFDRYDANTNAYLDQEEFRTALVMAGIPVDGQFATYDKNDDDRLDQDEYAAFFEIEAGDLNSSPDDGQAS